MFRANQAADRSCVDVLSTLNRSISALVASVEQYHRLESQAKRSDFEFNQHQRDMYIRFNEFKKNMVEREGITVQNYMMMHGMTAMDKEQHETQKKALKRKTREEEQADEDAIRAEVKGKKMQDLQLLEMGHATLVAELEAQKKQLETDIARLEDTVKGQTAEVKAQKDLTMQVATRTIASEAAKRARLHRV
eukprot:TRINITY_DN21301_c1_g4_i1.p1 TRINITY_DN21301_c1_g4~~TRINITY_DN21301_c1_g4_i1.p1  ORF type:complete len:192 (+),score=83.85 TRINITY_DN21301_c1_g4_i1:104-679(+)